MNTPNGATSPPPSNVIPLLILAISVWGTFAPYLATAVGLDVPVEPIVEVVDHVVPGVLIMLIAGFALRSEIYSLIPSLIAVLASFWMVTTHVGLLKQGVNGGVSLGAALFHSMPGILLLALTMIVAVKAYQQAPD